MQPIVITPLRSRTPAAVLVCGGRLRAGDACRVVDDAQVLVLADLLQVCREDCREVGAAGDRVVGACLGVGTQGGGHLLSDVLENVSALHVLDRAVQHLLPRRRVDGRRVPVGRRCRMCRPRARPRQEAGGNGSDGMWHGESAPEHDDNRNGFGNPHRDQRFDVRRAKAPSRATKISTPRSDRLARRAEQARAPPPAPPQSARPQWRCRRGVRSAQR